MISQYAHYVAQDGTWIAQTPDWEDIREAPHHRVWRLWCDDGRERLGMWAAHPFTRVEGWHSWVDPTLPLRPLYYRDLVRPPGVPEREAADAV